MDKVKMINVDALPNIPWQERPADLKTESPVWRYSENPVMGRNPTPEIARIFNSAVVPWEDGYIAVLRGEQINGIPYVYLGHSKDGIHWDVEREKVPFTDENGQPKMRRRRLLRGIHLSGLFMFDADKLTIDPYEVYQRTLAPGFPWKVRLAHKTSSGHGLRLVCEIRVELGNIADNQICLARDLLLMGVLGSTGKPVVDDSCIDACRISYACRREDIYFIDEENLF